MLVDTKLIFSYFKCQMKGGVFKWLIEEKDVGKVIVKVAERPGLWLLVVDAGCKFLPQKLDLPETACGTACV